MINYSDQVNPAVLLPGDYDFDIIELDYSNLRILGENSSLTITPDTTILGNASYGEYSRLEVEGTIYAPDTLEIKNLMLVPLSGLEANVQNIVITDEGGLELHAAVSPNPRGVYHFNNITVGNDNTWINTLRLVPFINENTDYTDDYGVTLQVDNLTVNWDGVIEADGQGYSGGMGPGKGANGTEMSDLPGGAGYGGEGGIGADGAAGGNGYGSMYTPTMLGSGGGNSESYPGGAGGGAIKLEVANNILLNGTVSANAEYRSGGARGGGGSGGSIWIAANSLTGYGQIEASGEEGGNYYSGFGSPYKAGAGAGGRVAIDVSSEGNNFSGRVYADGAWSNIQSCGADGTVYWVTEDRLSVYYGCSNGRQTILEEGNYDFETIELTNSATVRITGENSTLSIDNTTFIGDGKGRLAVEGTITAPMNFTFNKAVMLAILNRLEGPENITLQDGGGLELYAGATPDGIFNFGDITVANGGTLRLTSFNNGDTVFTDDYGVTLRVNNLTVDQNGRLEADGQGYPFASGPGKGTDATGLNAQQPGGGGYGGKGGDGSGGSLGGATYGDVYTPILLGSGGGKTDNGPTGGAGGGAFKLEVANALSVNGIISSNGKDGIKDLNYSYSVGGGGSGGSIWIVAPVITGTGHIQAKGGQGVSIVGQYGQYYGHSGGGGGGRITIDAASLASTITISVAGGAGNQVGITGTVLVGVVDPVKSTVQVAPEGNVTADGANAATLTVVIRNQDNLPISNKRVEIALEAGQGLKVNGNAIGTNYVWIGNTDNTGTVTATLTSTASGIKTLKARVEQTLLVERGTVEFVAGPVNIDESSFMTNRTTAPADGETPVRLTVLAQDSFGNPVSNATVTLQVSSQNAVVTLLSEEPKTNPQGAVHWEIVNSVSEMVVISAWINDFPLPDKTIAFKGADISVTLTAPSEAPAGRNAEIAYVVNVRNSYYLPAPDTELILSLPSGITCIDDTLGDPGICQAGEVVPLNIGLLDPGEVLSFTLYAQIDSSWDIGEAIQAAAVVTTTAADEDPTNNSTSVATTMVSGYAFEASVIPSNQTVGIGSTATFVIEVENTGLLADEYQLNATGLESTSYAFSQNSLGLLPQEKRQVTLSMQYAPETCSDESILFNFTVNVVGKSQNETQAYPITAIFQSDPLVFDLRPTEGSTIGSNDVTISWRTDAPTTGVLTISALAGEPPEQRSYPLTAEDTSHSILVEDLGAKPYEWSVTAISACGEATTAPQQFTVESGVVFKNHQPHYEIKRDYDQLAKVWVKNQSDEVREVRLSIQDVYDDLIVNFRGAGGVDETITLLPREERAVELAIHAQDAALQDYSINATLTSTDGTSTVTDVAVIDVHVLFPTAYRLEEKGVDPLSGGTVYRVTNDGQPITDLNIRAVIAETDLPAPVYITPQIVHARLDTGEWLEFKVIPLYSAEHVTNTTGGASPAKMLSVVHQVSFPDIDIISDVAGESQRRRAQSSCGGGRQIYAVTLRNVVLPIPFHAWYCTNRPNIEIPLELPPFVHASQVKGATLEMGFVPRTDMRPHDTTLYFNGHEIARMANQVPNGLIPFAVDPSYLKTNPFTGATQNISLRSVHNNNGGDEPHHSSQIGGTLYVALEEVTVYVCATSQEEAEQLARTGYGFTPMPTNFGINITKPSATASLDMEADGSINIQAELTDDNTSYINFYKVEAELEYLDELLAPSETILLFDDGFSIHGDPDQDDRSFNALWMPKYGGNIRLTVTATMPDGRTAVDEITFSVSALPDLAVTKVYVEEVTFLNNHARVRAEITNLGFSVSGPVNVDFRYYLTNADGNKIGEPIHTSHLQILTGLLGFPTTLERGDAIEIEDTEFTPNSFSLYFVEVVVDP